MAVSHSAPTVQPLSSRQTDSLSCAVDEFDTVRFPPRDVWLRLFERSRDAHVTHHPDAVRAAFPELGIPGWVVTCRRGSEPEAMAIMIPKHCRFGRSVLPGASSSLVGVRLAGLGFLGSQADDVSSALVQAIAEQVQARRIRVVEFENVEETSSLWRSLQKLRPRGFRFAPVDAFDLHHRIRFPDSADAYWNRFHSRQRYRLRKERKRIGEYEVRRYTRPDEAADWLSAAHEVSRRSWQSHQLGLRIRNSQQELEQLTFLATLGALRSYVLFLGGQPAAFVQSHQWNGVYHYDELGFDRQFAKQNPGKVLLQEILDDLLAHDPPQTFDFGLGDADYKRFFANEQSRSATLWMFPPGTASWWQSTSIHISRKAGRLARELLGKTRLYAAIRQSRRDAAATDS